MSRLTGTILDKDVPSVVKVSRIGMALVLGLLLVVHGMIIAI